MMTRDAPVYLAPPSGEAPERFEAPLGAQPPGTKNKESYRVFKTSAHRARPGAWAKAPSVFHGFSVKERVSRLFADASVVGSATRWVKPGANGVDLSTQQAFVAMIDETLRRAVRRMSG